jgi:hypothetical protein
LFFSFLPPASFLMFIECSNRYAEKGDGQQGVSNHRWPEYPPNITVVLKETVISGMLCQLAQQPAAGNAPARKEYQH